MTLKTQLDNPYLSLLVGLGYYLCEKADSSLVPTREAKEE